MTGEAGADQLNTHVTGNGHHQSLSALTLNSPEVRDAVRDLRVEEILSSVTPETVRNILAERFVFVDDLADLFAAGLRNGENIVLWGPRGHAKSAMVEHLISRLGLNDECRVLDCGVGLEEATLFGGLDIRALNERAELDYNVGQSIFGRSIAVLEEIFDAPPEVLSSLKNTLTSKEVHKGNFTHPSRLKLIVACTNRSPAEIEGMGESYRALVDRFPLRAEVKWDKYDSQSYYAMYQRLGYPASPDVQRIAEIIARSGQNGMPVSPRTAVKALKIAFDSAKQRGLTEIDGEAIFTLRHFPELSASARTECEEWAITIEAEKALNLAGQYGARLLELIDNIKKGQAGPPISWGNQVGELFEEFQEKTSGFGQKARKNLDVITGKFDEALMKVRTFVESLDKKPE